MQPNIAGLSFWAVFDGFLCQWTPAGRSDNENDKSEDLLEESISESFEGSSIDVKSVTVCISHCHLMVVFKCH